MEFQGFGQQGLSQFEGDIALGGEYRIAFEYTKNGDNISTVVLKTKEQDGTPGDDYISVLRNKLMPRLHTEMKDLLRSIYGDDIKGKNVIIIADNNGYEVGNTREHLHDNQYDMIFTQADITEKQAQDLREFAQTVLEFHMLFHSYVLNKGYTIGSHLQRLQKKDLGLKGYE
jgi:hypothetical protein